VELVTIAQEARLSPISAAGNDRGDGRTVLPSRSIP
jgi:hypothetical protein